MRFREYFAWYIAQIMIKFIAIVKGREKWVKIKIFM